MEKLYTFIAQLLIKFAKSRILKDIIKSDLLRSQFQRRLISASRYMLQNLDILNEMWSIKGILQFVSSELNPKDYYAFLVWMHKEIGEGFSPKNLQPYEKTKYQEILRDLEKSLQETKEELQAEGVDPSKIDEWTTDDLMPTNDVVDTQAQRNLQYPRKHTQSKDFSDVYFNHQTSYSGTDMICTINIPGKGPVVFGELSSISYSIYREKVPVRALGRVSMKGYTRGMRTISGILTFTVFEESIVYRCMEELRELGYRILMDEMPLFDITISMANEFGSQSMLTLYGVTTYTEGKVMSVDDIMTQNVYEFYALDIDPLSRLQRRKSTPLSYNHAFRDLQRI
jgi:hypothetical protein